MRPRGGEVLPDIEYRRLAADEVDRVEEIDRSEVIDHIYYLRDGKLVLEDEHWELKGWAVGDMLENKRRMRESVDRGGAVWGAFDGETMVGIAVLDGKRIGSARDTLHFYFLHVSRDHRDQGIGGTLTGIVKERARETGAQRLYVSGLPSLHTIAFYQGQGFDLAREVDPELYELEPEDIHMDIDL